MNVWLKRFLLVSMATVVCFSMAEITLRIAGISYPSFYKTDEYTGATLRPGANGWYKKEGIAYISINNDGLRDREHTKKKSLNTIRIAVLGDSYAEAVQIPMEKTFWSIMERELKECEALCGKDVEVINFGVSGYGTARELLALRHRAWDYSPDIVVLTITTGNDIRDNSKELNQIDYIPYFVLEGDNLILDKSYLNSNEFNLRKGLRARLLETIINYSRIVQISNEARGIIRIRKLQKKMQEIAHDLGNNEAGLDNMIYQEPIDPAWKEAWQITEKLIVQMRNEVKEKGASFLVVTLTSGIQVNPSSSLRKEFMDKLGVKDLFYPEKRIKALGEREGIEVLTLAQSFQIYAEQNHVFFHGFQNTTFGSGHWNENGHSLAGKLISKEICQQIIQW